MGLFLFLFKMKLSLTEPQMSPSTLAGIDRPHLLGVEVNIPAMDGVESVRQHAALPIKRLAVTVVPGGEIQSSNKKYKLCKCDFVFLLN